MVSNPDFELCEVVKWLKTALVKQLDCQEVCFEKEVIKWGTMDTIWIPVESVQHCAKHLVPDVDKLMKHCNITT